MTSSPSFRSFAFAYTGRRSRSSTWRRSRGILRCSPSIRRSGSSCRSRSGVRCTRDVLVRLDGHGRARSAGIRPGRRLVARAMDATALARVVVGGPRARDGCVRLPHDALFPTLQLRLELTFEAPDGDPATGKGHAKAGNAWAISGYFEEAMGSRFALAYADQAEGDHAALRAAVKAGRIEVYP
jgi:hypothetical protein